MPEFKLYSRADCCLCEAMLQQLASLPETRNLAVEVIDVDAREDTRRRFGHKIPVLTYADELVCHGALDLAELHKTLQLQALRLSSSKPSVA